MWLDVLLCIPMKNGDAMLDLNKLSDSDFVRLKLQFEEFFMNDTLFYKVLRYQRRGENAQFHCIVTTEDEVLQHSEKYFQDSDFDTLILNEFRESHTFILYA